MWGVSREALQVASRAWPRDLWEAEVLLQQACPEEAATVPGADLMAALREAVGAWRGLWAFALVVAVESASSDLALRSADGLPWYLVVCWKADTRRLRFSAPRAVTATGRTSRAPAPCKDEGLALNRPAASAEAGAVQVPFRGRVGGDRRRSGS